MKSYFKLLIILFFVISFGCNKQAKNIDNEFGERNAAEPVESSDNFKSKETTNGLYSTDATDGAFERKVTTDAPISSDKIIRTGDIGIRLNDYKVGKQSVYQIIKSHKGAIAQENEQNETYRISNDLQIRVPNAQFDVLVESLTTGKGIRNIDYKRINTQDVGKQYTDLESRLKTKKEVEQQYLSILKQAKSIKDILEVTEHVRQLREEIEATEGRLRYLSNQISFSTINLNIYQELEGNSIIERPGFFHKLLNALQGGWNGTLSLFIGIAALWPLWLIIGALVYLIRKRKWFKR